MLYNEKWNAAKRINPNSDGFMKNILALLLTMAALYYGSDSQVLSDSLGKLPDDDVYARIDRFGGELRKNPDAVGHAVVYKAHDQPLGAYLRYFYGIQDVWKIRGYPDGRLVLHAGQERPDLYHDFWILGKGEVLSPKEFSIEKKLLEQVGEKRVFDTECIGCTPAVKLHHWIFREGLDYYGTALKANRGSRAEITIGRNEFVSGTKRERDQLSRKIISVLSTKYNIPRGRIRIRFIKSMFATFYIVPMRTRVR